MRGAISLWLLLVFGGSVVADDTLTQEVARMFVIGVPGDHLAPRSAYARMLRRLPPGGVILFDEGGRGDWKRINVRTPDQLKRLTGALQRHAARPLLIGVDQEGGHVARLKEASGFVATPSAARVAEMGLQQAYDTYARLARELHDLGINTDFAPVVDLAANPKNRVIVGLERSYGADPERVVRYASLFVDALRAWRIVPVLKHFPGHGSSVGDTHEGFVDTTELWQSKELIPYRELIALGEVDMVMTAHIFNRRLDPRYPATLSERVIGELLRRRLRFRGVVITDAMEMGAIARRYAPAKAAALAIKAGADLLLFAEIRDPDDFEALVQKVVAAIKRGEIDRTRIREANRRLEHLIKKYRIGEGL